MSKRDKKYVNVYLSFDIETTQLEKLEQAFMYSFCIGINDTDYIRGRTWEQFKYVLNKIKSHSRRNDIYVIWVYNLDFEFSFLRGIYDFTDKEVFALQPHRILKCNMFDNFEFRCANKLAGQQLNLKRFMIQEGVPSEYIKTDLYDYNKTRFSDSKLKRYEIVYIRNDCIGLNIAVKHFIENRGYNIRTVPLTITGFLRVDLRQKMRKEIGQKYFTERQPDTVLLEKFHLAFRGGNTHANALYIGKTLKEVYSKDIKSSYPAQLYYGKYPIDKFKPVLESDYKDCLADSRLAKLMHIEFKGIALNNFFEAVPYIPISKCFELSKDYVADNGRVREAAYFRMWVTDVDFDIISSTYSFNFNVLEMYVSRYSLLPQKLRDFIYHIFEGKETLQKDTIEYQIYKGLLNSIYGDFVMYPLKPNVLYNEGVYKFENRTDADYDKYIKKNTKLYYWGVWCTALARKELQDMISMIDSKDFVYCDTDSIKFKGKKYIKLFDKYNKQFSDKKLHLGYFTDDSPFKYDNFKTFGAKKYAYEVDGHIHMTVAGVPKSAVSQLKTLDDFTLGKVFRNTGKKRIVHNDNYGMIHVKHHEVNITANACLLETEYTLDITKELRELSTELYFKFKGEKNNEDNTEQ